MMWNPAVIVGDSPMVLVDGYLRVAALSRLGRDTILAEQWMCDEAEALVRLLLRKQDRRLEAIEEAWLIRELRQRYGIAQEKMARLLGRHQCWVSRRLLLLESLSEEILEAVRQGAISTWSVTRVLAAHGALHAMPRRWPPLLPRSTWRPAISPCCGNIIKRPTGSSDRI